MTTGQQAKETSASNVAPTPEVTMRAVVQDAYGSADVLRLARIPKPEIADNEVLVRVRAAGLDRGTWHIMTGKPYALRLAFGFRRPKNPVPGLDLAGIIEAVGPGVTRFAVGDHVFGVGKGSFAEYAVAGEGHLAPMGGKALGPQGQPAELVLGQRPVGVALQVGQRGQHEAVLERRAVGQRQRGEEVGQVELRTVSRQR